MIPKELLKKARKIRSHHSIDDDSSRDISISHPLPLGIPNEFKHSIDIQSINDELAYDKRLYELVCDVFEGIVPEKKKGDFSPVEKEELVVSLNNNGYYFSLNEFYTPIKAAREYQKKQRWHTGFRPAIFNDDDYSKLKDEIENLSNEIGTDAFVTACPTLAPIMAKAKENEGSDYPGRRLPLDNFRDRKRYIYLRIMDEILYTSEGGVRDKDMKAQIIDKAGPIIDSDKEIKDEALKKYYSILSHLISVDRNLYERDVFDTQNSRCKKYKKPEEAGGRKFMAFYLELSLDECNNIAKEISNLPWNKISGDYPLLNALTNLNPIINNENINVPYEYKSREIKETGLINILYQQAEDRALKRAVRKAVKNGNLIKGNGKTFIPINILEKGSTIWSLLSKDFSTGKIKVLTQKDFAEGYHISKETAPNLQDVETEYPIVGTSELMDSRLYDVTLRLTSAGVYHIRKLVHNRPTQTDSISHFLTRREYDLSFQIYLNNDFFDQLYFLDKSGNLINLGPEDVLMKYEEYFRNKHGEIRIPYEERPERNKRLKITRKE